MLEKNTECPQCGYNFITKFRSNIKGKIVAICPQCRYEYILGLSKGYGNIRNKTPGIIDSKNEMGIISKNQTTLRKDITSSNSKKQILEKKEFIKNGLKEQIIKNDKKFISEKGKLNNEIENLDKKKQISKNDKGLKPSKKFIIIGIILIICGITALFFSAYRLVYYKNIAEHEEVILTKEKFTINSTNRLVLNLGEKEIGDTVSAEIKLEKGKILKVYIVDNENHSKLENGENALGIANLIANSTKLRIENKTLKDGKYYLESWFSDEKINSEIWYYKNVKKGSNWSEGKLVFYSLVVLICSFFIIKAGFSLQKIKNFRLVFLGALLFTFCMIFGLFSFLIGGIITIILWNSKKEFLK